MRTTRSTLDEIDVLIRARYPVIYIVSWEEARVTEWLTQAAKSRQKRVFEWSYSTGIVPAGTSIQSQKTRQSPTKDPIAALDQVIDQVEPAVFIFKDLHPFLARQNFAVIRRLKEVAQEIKSSHKTIIVIAPTLELPCELEKEVTVVDFPLPEVRDFSIMLDKILAEVKGQASVKVELTAEARERLLKAALGLTLSEAENVFAKILVSGGKLGEKDVAQVFAEKRQIIRKNGLLDYYETEAKIADVGGLALLKEWLEKRGSSFSDKAREFGLPSPKGVFLLGVQGCGKSLCAKAVASLWHMPLLRMDVGRLFGSLVGSSEENLRRAIQIAESIAPAVLWIDEIEKALSGSKGGGSLDGGVTSRVFGTFLTWMSEKSAPVFVVATANDISALPPELLRKGRFDEIFFIDLPDEKERAQIFEIHLRAKKRDPKTFDAPALARLAVGFSGSEIEESIVSALHDAFASGKQLEQAHIEKAIQETVPLSRTASAELSKLRAWADGHARFAVPHVARKSVDGPLPRVEFEVTT